MYKLDSVAGVINTTTGEHILPIKSDPRWIEYQAWVHAGNVPEPADAPPEPGPDLRPRLVVTNVVTSYPDAQILPGDVTVPVGTSVSVTVEMRGPDDVLIPLTAVFRMPFAARDGRERILLAQFAAGVATIGTTCGESGCWQIDESTINRDLAAGEHMRFEGLKIFVVQ